MNINTIVPTNDYDTEAWAAYWAANPGVRRSLSAAVSEDTDNSTDGDQKPDDSEKITLSAAEVAALKKAADEATALRKAAEKARKDAEKASKDFTEAQTKLKLYEGIDPEIARKMLADQAAAEEELKLKRGEFEAIRKQMMEKHEAEKKELLDRLTNSDSKVERLTQIMENQIVGSHFDTSTFITEETVLTPSKARALYGAHFDVVESAVVGYDKPRGEANRAPLVDASGKPLPFKEAIKTIIEADPDKDALLRAKAKPGSGSNPPKGSTKTETTSASLKGIDKIKIALSGAKK